MQKGKLYLIPNTLGSDDLGRVIPPYIKEVINTIEHYIVENIQTAVKVPETCGNQQAAARAYILCAECKSKESDITTYLDETEGGERYRADLRSRSAVYC